MIDVYVGLGSNMGHRMRYLSRAIREIADIDGANVVAVSHAYESEPWGVEDQEPFANAVILVSTTLRADQLMQTFAEIEKRMGRTPGVPNGPRPIDLDILFYGDEEWETPELEIPHPRMAERDFIITPLLEIAPDATWPDGSAVTREDVRVGRVIRDLGPIPDPGLVDQTPITTDDWVVVAEGATVPLDMGLRFKEMVLEQAQIPYTWDPYPPEEESHPFGMSIPVKLRVPSEFEEKARAVILEAEQAPLLEEQVPADELEPELGWPEG